MGDQTTDHEDPLTPWVIGGSLVIAAGLIGLKFALSWKTQVLAGALQLLGLGLTLLGVAVVRSWLALARDTAIDAKHGLDRWWALTEERLRTWWAHLRGRGVHLERSISDTLSMSDSASIRKQHYPRVDSEGGSDRDWLIHLDQHLHALYEIVDKAEQNSRAELDRRLASERKDIRAEIQRETRQGWQLIVAGLVWSALGTGVGAFG